MIIDLVFAVLLILAVLRGLQRGLIVGIFSLVAVVIGLAAAMKLSTVAAGYIGRAVKISEEWLPLIAFALIFLVVVLLIRLGANAIERTIEVAMLGWVNKLGGVILYVVIYTTVFSVLLFYAEQMKLVQTDTIRQSLTYTFIQPWGPKAINGVAAVVPIFKDMFTELETFFSRVAGEMS